MTEGYTPTEAFKGERSNELVSTCSETTAALVADFAEQIADVNLGDDVDKNTYAAQLAVENIIYHTNLAKKNSDLDTAAVLNALAIGVSLGHSKEGNPVGTFSYEADRNLIDETGAANPHMDLVTIHSEFMDDEKTRLPIPIMNPELVQALSDKELVRSPHDGMQGWEHVEREYYTHESPEEDSPTDYLGTVVNIIGRENVKKLMEVVYRPDAQKLEGGYVIQDALAKIDSLS